MKISFDKDEILSAIDRVAKKTMTMDLTWDWPCGVAYYGLAEAYKATGKTEYMEFLKNWVDEYMEMGLPSWNVNTCAMGHCLITLYEYTGDKKYWDIIMSKIDYLRNDALRFGDHVLQHTVSSNNDFPEQCWADTLFMAAFLMLRVGSKLRMLNPDDPKDAALMEYQPQAMDIINDSLNQYYWHIQYLQNKETSLWYHGYNNVHKDHMSGFYWGRANAWAAYTMSQVKKNLYDWYLFPPCMDVECSLRDQLAALKLVQTENGLWRTILDDEESYEEVSASRFVVVPWCGNVVWQRWSGHPVQRSECGPVYRHVGVEYHLVLGWYGYESCGGQTYRLARCGIGYARGAGHDFYHGRVYLLVIWFIWQICYVDFPGIFIAGGGHVLYGLSLGFLHLAQ